MSAVGFRIPVGVVVERRAANSGWADLLWRPIAVLAGRPDAAAWTPLAQDGETVTYYAGAAEIELHRSEADNYRRNLAMQAPSIWVALQPTGGEPPHRLAVVTADPAEGESLSEAGDAIVEAVAMPEPVREIVAAFLEQCPVGETFVKRRRDHTDPQAMARRGRFARRPYGQR
jgi:hypothetical protein